MIMDEPTIQLFVDGARQWRGEKEWPLARTQWTKYFLRPRHKLATAPEPLTHTSNGPLTMENPSTLKAALHVQWCRPKASRP